MKKSTSHIVRLLSFALLALTASVCQAQLPQLKPVRPWSPTPVSPDELQVLHVSDTTWHGSEYDILMNVSKENMRVGNTAFTYTHFKSGIDLTSSWYDPDKADEWIFRYNQLLFDIYEISVILLENAYNQALSKDDQDDIRRKNTLDYLTRRQDLISETVYGTDTAQIARWERYVKRELEMFPRTAPRAPRFDYENFVGYYLGTNYMAPLGSASQAHTHRLNGSAGLEIGIKNYYIDLSVSGGGYYNLLKSGYFKSTNGTSWEKDGKINRLDATLNLGYTVLCKQYYMVTPFAGIGHWHYEYFRPNESTSSSVLNGTLFNLGCDANWILFNDHRPMNTFGFSGLLYLKLRTYLQYDAKATASAQGIWSLNAGLTLGVWLHFPKRFNNR